MGNPPLSFCTCTNPPPLAQQTDDFALALEIVDAPQLSAAGYERRKPALGLNPFFHIFIHLRIGRPQPVQREQPDVHGLVFTGRDIAVRRFEVDIRKVQEDLGFRSEIPR